MLAELRVQNLLLMERAELVLESGLNVITGETGAGKTMLAHAIDLLLGGKPRRGVVRPGADEAYVEGVFEPSPALFTAAEFDDLRERVDLDVELVLARRVTAAGRSRAYLQGRSVSAAELGRVGAMLLGFFGQHEHRRLTLASAQLDVIDGFCGAQQIAERTEYEQAWARAVLLRRELEQLTERAGARERDLDLLEFELEEIEQAAPSEDDERQLEAERRRLRSVEQLRDAAQAALEQIDGADGSGAADRLAVASGSLQSIEGEDVALAQLAARSAALTEEARDLGSELAGYVGALSADPERLVQLEDRLDLLARLKRKHGGTIAAVLEHAERCRSERDRLANAADESERLSAQLERLDAELGERAAQLGDRRRAAADELAAAVRSELADLAMADASFDVLIESGEPGPKGSENVEFEIAPNPGVPAGPLREIASGGELSRVMLALMTIATGTSGTPTVVFDEVDAGIGGATARSVGQKLATVGRSHQVICITHLPQVASLADRHFSVSKGLAAADAQPGGGDPLATTRVARLDRGEVVEELCRMLGADADDGAARKHAERLLKAA